MASRSESRLKVIIVAMIAWLPTNTQGVVATCVRRVWRGFANA